MYWEHHWLYIKWYLSICKSLAVVLDFRKVSCLCSWALEISSLCAWVLVIWDYIVSEISLEVQGGQDYCRFVEGTCIIAWCLSSLSLNSVFIRYILSHWSLLQKLIDSYFWTVTSVGETKKKLTQFCWNKGVSQVTYWVLTITRY